MQTCACVCIATIPIWAYYKLIPYLAVQKGKYFKFFGMLCNAYIYMIHRVVYSSIALLAPSLWRACSIIIAMIAFIIILWHFLLITNEDLAIMSVIIRSVDTIIRSFFIFFAYAAWQHWHWMTNVTRRDCVSNKR